MNNDIINMIEKYETYDLDWMGDKILSLSDLTRHHIVKKQYGGEDSIDNYALLTCNSHHLIHFIEENYYNDYLEINKLLKELNISNKKPNKEYYKKMNFIMKSVRKKIKNKRRGRS